MVGTVGTDLALFIGATSPYYPSDCDQVADWSGSPTLDATTFVQGTGALSAKVSKAVYESTFALKSDDPNRDIRGKVIYVWAMCSGRMDTRPGENGYGVGSGFRIKVYEGANWGEWDIAGRNTWAGGWTPWVVHTDTAFSRTSATPPTLSAVTRVGVVFETVGSAAAINCWWDALRIGTGLQIKGGTEGSPSTLQDFLTTENLVNNKWGVMYEYEGLLIVQGKLTFGSTTPEDNTYFKDTSERVIIFPDKPFPADFYEIKLQGNTGTPPTYYTKIYFGQKVGTRGVLGPIVRATSPSRPFKVTASDTNITEYGFYGCTFYQAGTITLQPYSTVKEFLSCSVSKSAKMVPGTGIVQDCNFVSAPGQAIELSSTSHHMISCRFISNSRAIHIMVAGPFSFNALDFIGNTYDVLNTSGVSVTVNYSNTDDEPSTYDPAGDPVTFQASVTLTVRHVKTGSEPTEYVRCYIEKTSDHSQIMNQDATEADDQYPTYYKASMSYTATGIAVTVRARERGYLPFETQGTITSNGLDITAIWIPDPNYQP